MISYTYDHNGNQLTVTNSAGTITRVYDELGRTVSKTSSGQGAFTYRYDVTSGVPSYCTANIITDPKSNVSTKVYDRAGRLYQVIVGSDTTTYTYLDNGLRASIAYPNGLTTEYTYYAKNNLHTLANKNSGTILEAFSYAYDDNGNMSSKVDVKGTTDFIYDALNRLASITEANGTVTEYTYDAAGNRIGEVVTANGETVGTDYSYNAQNRLTGTEEAISTDEAKITDYFYDNNGNTIATREQTLEDAASGQTASLTVSLLGNTAEGSAVYEYDGFDQLTGVTQDSSTLEMAYNGEGLRVSKEVTIDDQLGEVQYLYENSNVVLELNSGGTQTAYSVYGEDTLLSRAAGGETLYYLYNGHGDVTALTDENGDVVASYYYDVFGNIVEETGDSDNSVRYAGYQYDEETGLFYVTSRYYNPETARFLTEDTYYGSQSDPLSLNLYTYCSNNPIIYIDPTGHWQEGDQYLSPAQQAEIAEATRAYYNATTQVERDAAHAAAEAARNGTTTTGNSSSSSGTTNNTSTSSNPVKTPTTVLVPGTNGNYQSVAGYFMNGSTYMDNGSRMPEGAYVYTQGGWYTMQNNVGVAVSGVPVEIPEQGTQQGIILNNRTYLPDGTRPTEGAKVYVSDNTYWEMGKNGSGTYVAPPSPGPVVEKDTNIGSNGNWTYYSQNDPKWKDTSYNYSGGSGSTISSAGCGPTSIAMVIASFADESITPTDTAQDAIDNGYRVNGGTSNGLFFYEGNKYGFNVTKTTDINKAISALNDGNSMVIVSVEGSKTTGHFTGK